MSRTDSGSVGRPPIIPVAILLLFAARWPEATSLPNVDEFHSQMLYRFLEGQAFGLSRVIRWDTVSQHFRAPKGARTDFAPENDNERDIVARWSSGDWQVGLYVFGTAIKIEPEAANSHRALKGPALLTENTPRADLPAWHDVYPVAAEAMLRFQSGATSYTTMLNGWILHSRPVAAAKQTCVECHTYGPVRIISRNASSRKPPTLIVGDPLGGVIYMYRREAGLK
ncbi:MAG: hypothetical protein ABI972_21130 [Acidobacteriota bacterium]